MNQAPSPLPEAALRVGCVGYLNARPLIAAYPGPVMLGHPSTLAGELVAGRLDVALVPVFEALRTPGFWLIDGVAIAANGPVWSVFVARRPGQPVEDLVLDPASLSSANLSRILFPQARFHEVSAGTAPAGAPQLLIGNQAIEFRQKHGDAFEYIDLAGEWKERTGLPFVFALWLVRRGLAEPERVAEQFRTLAREGRAMIPTLAAAEGDPAFALRYLSEHLCYELGAAEKAGLALYRERLIHAGRLPAGPACWEWI